MATGWRLSTSTSNDQVFTDAGEYDAIFRTESMSQRLLFGASSNVASTLAVSASNAAITGDLLVTGVSYSDSHVVNNNLRVGFIPDVEAAINNISVGGGLGVGAVTSNVIASSNVLARHIQNGSILDQHIAGVLSVGIGGTGVSNVSAGSVLFGDGTNPLATHAALAFDRATETLTASNLLVTGAASVRGVPDIEAALSNLADGSSILADAVSNVHLSDACVRTSNIADGNVTEAKLAGVLSVGIGGTGVSNVSSGSVLFGDGTNPLATHAALAFDRATETLTASNLLVTGAASVRGVPDIEAALSNLADGSAILADAVSNVHLSDACVRTSNIADSNVTEAKLAGVLSVGIGGTGVSNVSAGSVLFGDGTNPLATHATLAFDRATETLTASNLLVTGAASVRGVPDIEAALSNLADGSAILADAVSNVHLSDACVRTSNIADSNVTEAKLAGVLSVGIGGTGVSNVSAGSVLFGDGTNPLATHATLAFDRATETLTASNLLVTGAASVRGVPDIEAALSNLADGSAILADAVSNVHLSDACVRTSNIADSNVTEAKLAGVLSVGIGGTGVSNVSAGSVLFGDGTNPLATHATLAFEESSETLTASNLVVTGVATVGGVPDIEAALSNLADGSAILADAVSNVHLSDACVRTSNIADSNVTEAKLAGVLSVGIGGTGVSNVAAGSVLFGDGANPLATHAGLEFDRATETLTASNLMVTGAATVGGVPDIEAALSNLADGSAILADAVSNVHLSDACVRTSNIADSNVTEAKLAGVLSVGIGGTGVSNVAAGSVLFGDGANPLATHAGLEFDRATETLTASNLMVTGAATVGGVPDIEAALSNLADGSAILADAVSNVHLSDACVRTSNIADGNVTEAKLAGVLSIGIGGTGVSNVSAGLVLFGDGANPLATHAALAFDRATETLAASNLMVTGAAIVGGVPDIETALSNLADGSAILADAVSNVHLSDACVRTSNIADGNVTEAKLAGVLSVGIGGTGVSNVSAGSVLFGDGANPLATHAALAFDRATETLAASNLMVTGAATVGGVPDIEAALSNLADGSAILADAVSNVHLSDACVRTSNIADGNVTEAKLAGVLSVGIGGTGVSNVPAGSVLFGDGANPLKTTPDLTFYSTDSNLSTGNYTASNRVHTHDDLVIGAPGAQRFRFFVDSASNLLASSIDENNVETAYLNFGDLVALLSGVRLQT